MTLQELDQTLRSACAETYELAAPAGVVRAVVWNSYGSVSLYGDGVNLLDVPKVQIDIFYQDLADTIVADVKAALSAANLPYEIQDDSYDDDYALRRCILLAEVY